jgi:hypothetical protein
MVRDHDRIRLGWPHHEGKEWNSAAFDFLSPDVRHEATLVAAEALSDWESAGKPYMGQRKLKSIYQYVISCPAFRAKYVRPLDDNKEQE